jgi:hypothetical protein
MTTVVKIKENSWLAKLAAQRLETSSVAMVIGKTIHLHNSSKENFLGNTCWVRHEVAHVKQYAKLGFIRFIFLYLLETLNRGYKNNRFEVEARLKEKDVSILTGVYFT